MTRYGGNTKKIVFYDTDKRHADLKIRLQNDDISQNDFFRSLVTGYIMGDERVVEFLNEWRLENKKQSKAKVGISQKSREKANKRKESLLWTMPPLKTSLLYSKNTDLICK